MSGEKMNVNWFPGHMTKARRKIAEQLKLIDAVAEVVDARIPLSSQNPDLNDIIGNKPLIILLNKCDMADPVKTAQWVEYFKKSGAFAIPVDCKSGKGLNAFKDTVKTVLAPQLETYKQKGLIGKPLRVMVVGIPNVGKSSFINRISGGAKAKVENRPGVTRGNQWFTIDRGLELLDTPGVLWPKFDDAEVGENLAFTGAVTDRVTDTETLAMRLIEVLAQKYPSLLTARFGELDLELDGYDLLCEIGFKRGMRIKGGKTDTERAAAAVLEEFRNLKIGRITLEDVK